MKFQHALIAGSLFIFVGFVAITGILGWWFTQPLQPYNKETVQFVIPQGSSVRSIARQLEQKSLIRSQYAFQFAVWQRNLSKRIQAGAFMISPSQDVFSVADTLTSGTNDIWVTIPEGLRAEEIGELLAEALPEFELESPEFQSECHDYEGYLFPETYLIPVHYDTTQTCKLLRQEYGNKMTMAMRDKIHADGRTEEEVVTLASIVAREARKPSDMKMVAGILWNRIDIGMALQVDATLQYIKGYDAAKKTWWAPPLAADKDLVSPYNTYKNAGLPPGPISNPGLDALEAAVYPTPNDYIYYISNLDGSKMFFAETYDEHLVNIETHLR